MLSWILGILGAALIALFALAHLAGVATSGTAWYLAAGIGFLLIGLAVVISDFAALRRRRSRGRRP